MKLKVTIDVGPLPVTADDWELYTGSMKCARAARALTGALKRALRARARGATAPEAMKLHFCPVADRYAAHGARDTEPTHVAWSIMDRVGALTTKHAVR